MSVPIWTPTISVWDSWFIHSYAKTWHFCHFSFRFLDGIWWHIGSGYILIDLIAKDVAYFSTCLIRWINSFSRILFEDSVHCLFYLRVFRTCLCDFKLYLCLCVSWWDPVLILMCAKVISPYGLHTLCSLVDINIYLFSCIGSWLHHVVTMLYHAGSFVVVHRPSSCRSQA